MASHLWRLAPLCLSLALLFVSTPSHGGLNKVQAQALLQQGNALQERGDYAGALEKYREAHRLYPNYRIEYNMVLPLDALGQSTEVAELLDRLLCKAPELVGPRDLQAFKKRLTELRRILGRIEIACKVRGVEVLLDGTTVDKTPLDHPLYVRPGRHIVQLQTAERQLCRQALSLGPGEQAVIRGELATAAEKSEARRPKRLWAWISAGSAAAALASGVVLGVLAQRQYKDYEQQHDAYKNAEQRTDADRRRLDALENEIRPKALGANISFGVAGALALTSGLLFYLDWRDRPIVVAPQVSAGAGLVVAGSF